MGDAKFNPLARLRWVVLWALIFALPLLGGGCVSANLYLATEHLESSASPRRAYVLGDGALAIECEVEIGYRSVSREMRYIVVAGDEIARRVHRAQGKLRPGEPLKIYLGTDTPSRYVTTGAARSGLAEPQPALLDGATTPIELHPKDKDLPEISYEYGSSSALIERKGLLREEIDHSTRSPGGYALFALGILPALALDVVTSPVQLGVAIVYYAKTKDQFNLQPVGL